MLKYQPKQKPLAKLLSASNIPGRSRELGSLIKLAEQLQTLDSILNESVPALYKNQFQANGIKNRTLTITCHAASLATRLRVDKQTIIANMNDRLPHSLIQDIHIRIRPASFKNNSGSAERTLSKENAQMLLEEAEQVDDKNLKEILVRLAQHGS